MNPMVTLFFALMTTWKDVCSSRTPLRVVDLTHVFDNTTLNIPVVRGFESRVLILEDSGVKFQVEEFSSSTHAGTHIDAPCHFAPGLETVAEIPFDRLFAPAAVVDVRDKVACNNEYELQVDDLLQWEYTTGILLNDVILLVRSGWSRYWSNRTAYMGNPNNDASDLHYPGLAVSTVRWLVSYRNVYGVGVEPFTPNSNSSKDNLAHLILNGNSIYILENVDDMNELPLFGATLHVMPMKMGGACGAPTRIAATFPDTNHGSKYVKRSTRPQNLFLK